MRIIVDVPATSGNLGPGFDVAGMALTLYNRIDAAPSSTGKLEIEVRGEGIGQIPCDRTNIVVRAMARVFAEARAQLPSCALTLHNRIPVSRGLGSSAAARVGGVVVANILLGSPFSDADLLRMATELEGHPDNVAPALLGGVVLSSIDEPGGVTFVRLELARPPRLVALIPEREIVTREARRVLPRKVPMKDAVFNVGKTAMLVAGFCMGRDDLLRAALDDRLHQPYRAKLMPWLPDCLEAAVQAGALGAILSGAGSTMLAMTRKNDAAIEKAMLLALQKHEEEGRVVRLGISQPGATVKLRKDRR